MKTVSTMGSGSLGREVDLEVLVNELAEAVESSIEAKFTRDSMVTLRLDDESPAVTVYRTGTFQIRGAKSKEALIEAKKYFLNILDDINVSIQKCEFEHVTSVYISDLEQSVNLSTLVVLLGLESTEYEPEQFPGLIYRPSGSPAVMLVFSSGKIVITGETSEQRAKEQLETLRNKIQED